MNFESIGNNPAHPFRLGNQIAASNPDEWTQKLIDEQNKMYHANEFAALVAKANSEHKEKLTNAAQKQLDQYEQLYRQSSFNLEQAQSQVNYYKQMQLDLLRKMQSIQKQIGEIK